MWPAPKEAQTMPSEVLHILTRKESKRLILRYKIMKFIFPRKGSKVSIDDFNNNEIIASEGKTIIKEVVNEMIKQGYLVVLHGSNKNEFFIKRVM